MAITKNSQIDLNGNEMILDADGDTTITADTDDQIDIKVGGSDTVHMGLTTYNASDRIVLSNTGGNASATIVGSTSGESSVFMADGTSGDASYRGYVQYQHTNDNMNIGTAGAERVRITSDGDFLARQTSADVYDTNAGSSVRQFWGNQFSASNNTNSRVMIGSASYKGLVGGASVNSGGTKPIVNSYMAFEMIDATAGGEDGVIGFYTSSGGGSGTEKLRVDNVGITRSRNVNAVGQYSSAAGTQWISLADDASIGLTDTTAGAMLVCAYEGGTGSGAIFFANYYAGTTLISSNGSRTFANSDSDGAICVYKSTFSHSVFFKNRTGGTINVFACSVFSAHV